MIPTAAEKAASRPLNEDEIRSSISALEERNARLQDRWSLGLVLGNAGALAALSAKMLDMLQGGIDKEVEQAFYLAFPSLWLFMLGLVFAGIVPLLELLGRRAAVRQFYDFLVRSHNDPRFQAHIGARKRSIIYNVIHWGPEVMAGVLFVAGLAYPIVVLSVRYLNTGQF